MTENAASARRGFSPDDPVRSIMVRPVVDVGGHSTLRQVTEQMSGAGVGAVLVVRAGSAPGILSERDVVRALAEGATRTRSGRRT